MTELILCAVVCAALALALLYRLVIGPNAADRAITGDCIDILATCALVLYSVYSGRSAYMDIAMVVAILGFVSTVLIARYLEGRL